MISKPQNVIFFLPQNPGSACYCLMFIKIYIYIYIYFLRGPQRPGGPMQLLILLALFLALASYSILYFIILFRIVFVYYNHIYVILLYYTFILYYITTILLYVTLLYFILVLHYVIFSRQFVHFDQGGWSNGSNFNHKIKLLLSLLLKVMCCINKTPWKWYNYKFKHVTYTYSLIYSYHIHSFIRAPMWGGYVTLN